MRKENEGKMILVVDDDPFSVLLIEKALPECTISTCSPFEAVTFMQHKGINLLITDFSMPEMDGLKLAKTANRIYHIPVIMITGFSENMAKLKEKKDVDAVLLKPINIQELKRTVMQVLDKYYIHQD